MPLESDEKSELEAAAGLAIDLDEPESFIEALRRVALKKGDNARLSYRERNRWRLVAQTLASALQTLEGDKNTREGAQDTPEAQPTATEAPETAQSSEQAPKPDN